VPEPLAQGSGVVAHLVGQDDPVADALIVLVERLAAGQLEGRSEEIPVGQPDADVALARDQRVRPAARRHGIAAVRLHDLHAREARGRVLQQAHELGKARLGHVPIVPLCRLAPMRVDVGDIELYVREEGEGRPLVLLHGGPGLDGSVFFPEIGALAADGVRLLAVDHRGNGRSGAGDHALWTVPQMAADVEALIVALDLARPIVMGHSFGSFVAQQHMATHGTAAGYIFMGTVDSVDELLRIDERLAAFEPVALREQVARSWAGETTVQTAAEAAQLMRDQLPFHAAEPEGELVRRMQENLGEMIFSPEVMRHFATGGEYGLVDNRERLSELDIPVLVLSGELDRTTPAASAHRLAQLLRDADEVVVPGAAHMLLQEQPEPALAALRAFLARVPA
jgi:proline iminopeptidase